MQQACGSSDRHSCQRFQSERERERKSPDFQFDRTEKKLQAAASGNVKQMMMIFVLDTGGMCNDCDLPDLVLEDSLAMKRKQEQTHAHRPQ
ncbi:hypothetical protein chiPu_0006640 [Chiloscyllium punctatum]|uniref:Uncharacterized protein n=1 Tax=Chiloscyllium punctatum TaxID=137246 RepID=A0A401SCU5_CHIPU|nr:hypothetical protein [Chiloscyllium punctatum]